MDEAQVSQVAQHIPLIIAIVGGGGIALGVLVKAIHALDEQIESAVKKETENFRKDLEHHTREEEIWQQGIVHRLEAQDRMLQRLDQKLDRISQRFTFAALKALGEDESPSEES